MYTIIDTRFHCLCINRKGDSMGPLVSEYPANSRRKAFQDLAFQLMSWFVKSNDIDAAVEVCLQRIGEISRAGRAYVFLFHDNGRIMDNTHEWCAEGVTPEKENLQGLETSMFPWWMARLREGVHIHITSVEGLPEEASAEKEILGSQGIKSLLVLPLSIQGELGGYIGFDNVQDTSAWHDRDFQLLRMSADILGNAFERDRANQELVKAKEKAEQAAKSKAEFADYVAHEIRSPLTSISVMVEALGTMELSEEQKEYIGLIREGTTLLNAVINQTLDFSRAQAGRIQLECLSFDIADVIRKRIDIHRNAAAKKGVELSMTVDSKIPSPVTGDTHRLGQVFGNLVSNALKFTDSGSIRINAALDSAKKNTVTVRFSVSDTGKGIAEEAIPLLFERFSQESAATSRKHGGSGLGLAICKYLVQLMGGAIHVESKAGEGSVFTFTAQFGKNSFEN
ncbi:MAG: GAF domain-containing protein [Chitinivibrionales bacterium]|nr:GAF domain-containing protein [Chitinivibrionales bacterium]